MIAQLNRFFTTEEVRKEYQVPEGVAEDILPNLPVVITQADGTAVHLESDVDDFLTDFSRQRRKAKAAAQPALKGKPGRHDETLEIALYADEVRKVEKTWKEVFKACRERWPDDPRVRKVDQIRATHRRHFGPKHRRSN